MQPAKTDCLGALARLSIRQNHPKNNVLAQILRQKQSAEKDMQYVLEITTCDPTIKTMDHPHLTIQIYGKRCVSANRVLTKSHCE